LEAHLLPPARAEVGREASVELFEYGGNRVHKRDEHRERVELAHWVGGGDPAQLDMSKATDDELLARRVPSAPATERRT
jgi:hypothetical protein